MKTNFDLQKYHQYSLSELESMMPWERKTLITQVMQWLDSEKKRLDRMRNGRQRQ
jgi:hypothetical protein